ncbi:hypothetical protein CLV98_108156 [Dyadobacter jejuensis]|uniref:Uncharacterized protein n=1 Tax=Dyadobacter jejuensis TaxID=1082580 RepID=A0A316AHQ0_9BACT|nr:hypothetical protein [Dyadobacter jejuensis]PWJ57236.1 hypothetical protein CLV98_108156 [Dyadobacter jejuensis]
MEPEQESLHTLHEIRELMEKSSKFLSLSGLSGVFAGIFALLGATIAYIHFKTDWLTEILKPTGLAHKTGRQEIILFLFLDGLLVLSLSLVCGILLTVRKAQKRGLKVWNGSSRRLLRAMIVPLAAGGIFCIAMLHYGLIWLVFPTTLIFYGLALVTAARFTYPEVRYLGICEILIGCLALFMTNYAVLLWSVGFGLLHILYGLVMHKKYDLKSPEPRSGIGTSLLLGMVLCSSIATAQSVTPHTGERNPIRWYDQESIYMQGQNSYVKQNKLYTGNKALMKEFSISPNGLNMYFRSRRNRNIGLAISLAGSVGTIVSLFSNDRDSWKKFIWVSLGTGVAATMLNARANNQRDQAVWIRNRDALIMMEAQQSQYEATQKDPQ